MACAPAKLSEEGNYRDVTVLMSSSTRFDEARFAGEWYVIADFVGSPSVEGGDGLGPPVWYFEPRDGAEFGIASARIHSATPHSYRETGIGQFESNGFGRRARPPVWVLWIDEDFQSAVIGTPDGSFGAILNRAPALRADRLKAAREVLDFNGYDLSKLRMISQG